MSEVRLIDANALKEDLRRYFTDGVLDGVSAKVTFNQILLDIDNAPTVDLWEMRQEATENALKKAEVLYARPKGEWKLHGMIYYCSECGHDYEQGGNNFCGNCGARMKGGAE